MQDSIKSNDAWTTYWSKGFLTTFADIEGTSYEGEVKQYWHDAFSLLKNNGKVVDLGAGNGALLNIAKEFYSNSGASVKMIAVDSADISGSKFYTHNTDIEVLANTSIEDTGVDSQSADLCISQFGFEYAPRDQAVVELSRLLRSGGYFCAMIHHHESATSLYSKSAVEQIRLCQRSDLIETVENLLRRLRKLIKSDRDPVTDEKASTLRQYFNDMSARLIQYGSKLPDSAHIDYFLNELANLFGSKAQYMTFDEKLGVLKEIKTESDNYLIRSKAMLESTMSQLDMNAFSALLSSKGIEVQKVNELSLNNAIYAWALTAKKV